MALFFVIIVAASFVLTAFHYWKRFCDDEFSAEEWWLFLRWIGTGLLFPFVCWFLFNTGIIGAPVWPNVAPLSAGVGVWWKSFYGPLSCGWFFISSYWAGVTFVWLLWRVGEHVEERGKFFGICAAWSMLVAPVAGSMILIGGWAVVGMAMMLGALAFVHATLGVKQDKLPPSYARAQARISFGKYEEAEIEVIRELEHCEEDFDGWMMLAELYALHFHDLAAADQTIRDLCEQPATTPVQVSIALHRVADWHLKLAHDPIAAREALERICARMPGTHLDKMARQRISRLPASRAELLLEEQGKPLHLPQVPEEVNAPAVILPREEAALAANQCVAVLERNPDDVAAREKFARLLAESLSDVKTAIDQMELLLAMPKQPKNKRAEWLVTIAGWHARYRGDLETARLVYEEVVRDFPNTTQAFSAQRRINLINLQSRFGRRTSALV
jgi:hypothetical protein